MNLSKKHLVCVLWDDAHMSMDEFTPDEIGKDFHRAEGVKSFGLLVHDDEKGVTLATDEGATDGRYRKINFIPRGMITDIIDFGSPRKKTKRVKREKAPKVD